MFNLVVLLCNGQQISDKITIITLKELDINPQKEPDLIYDSTRIPVVSYFLSQLFNKNLPDGNVQIIRAGEDEVLVNAYVKSGKMHGEISVFDFSGLPKEKLNAIDGIISGTYLEFYKSGRLKRMVEFKNGIIHGDFLIFYENGYLNERLFYIDGKLTDYRETWHSNGVKHCEYYENSEWETNGSIRCWNRTGILVYDGVFNNGIPVGKISYYYDNGKLKKQGVAPNIYPSDHEQNLYTIREYIIYEIDGSSIIDCSIYEEWYEDGTKKVKVSPDKYKNKELFIEEFYSNGQIKAKGKMKLVKSEASTPNSLIMCWVKFDEWTYLNESGSFEKKVKF